MVTKLLKHALAALLVCALLTSLLFSAMAVSYPFSGVITGGAVLRKAASATSEPLASLPAGDAVYVTGESGNTISLNTTAYWAMCPRLP